ncbi:hypothetical protein HPG69_013652 [Diceros bicornis minor]|uniref:Uncharacterized protein n=1 Tax=Diceros bicornis minor TaxID=77932 RepID=A0A7J7FLM2_DICBM|nr:hypothetical protein HPG69_013652 [Diceros bicornis minor]
MLGVVRFLRSLFKTPEPDAHQPGEGEIEDKQLPASAEPEQQGWSQETDHEDFETLSHQSESQSDTKTDPFESASDTESLPGDLTGGLCLPPRGVSMDREAPWGCPDIPTARPPQEQHSTGVPGLVPKEERDVSLDLKEASYKSGSRALPAVAGERKAGHLWDSMASLEQKSLLAGAPHHTEGCSQGATGSYSLQPPKGVTVQDPRWFSVFSLQKSRSESCLGIPGTWPFLLWCCDLCRSWPHIHNRVGETGLPLRGPLDSKAPLGARTKKAGTPGPAVDTDLLCSQPCLDAPYQLPLGTSCLLHTKLCHSDPENIADKGRASPGHYCQHMRTLTTVHSTAGLPLRYPEDPPGKNLVKFGTHLKERTETEQDPRTQNPLHPVPTLLSHLLPASQRRAPYLQNQYKPSALSWKRASQDTPSEYLQPESQLGQDSRSCPVSSCLAEEVVSLRAEEVPMPAECKSERSPEIRPEEPRGSAPNSADVSDKQKHLQDITVEAGNQTSNYTFKYALSEKRKPLARAKFPHHSSYSRSQVWNRAWTGCTRVSECSDAPETTLKSSATDTSKEAEDVMVLDPNCTEIALQGFSEITAATVSQWGDEECDQGPEGGATPLAEGLQLEPKADTSSRGRCTLITVAVEQTGLQATRSKVGPLPETQSCEFLEERPESSRSAGATPSESPRAGKPQTDGNECEPPAARGLGNDAPAAEPGVVQIPQAASEERTLGRRETCSQERDGGVLSTEGSAGEKPPGAGQSPGTGADNGKAASPQHEDAHEARGPPRAPALPPGARPRPFGEASREPGRRLALPGATSLRKGEPSAAAGQGGGAGALGPGRLPPARPAAEALAVASPGPEELHAKGRTAAAGRQGAAGRNGTPPHPVAASASRKMALQGAGEGAAGLREGGHVETPGDLGSRRRSSESCDAKRFKNTEKRLRARLSLAHKPFANFFESKLLEKENTDECSPGSVKGQKERSRLRQSSWRAFLKRKDAEGPKRPSSVSLVPGREMPNPPRPSPPGTNSHCEEQAGDKESYVFRDHWAPPQSPTPLSSSSLVSPDNRRKSEPTIKCTSPQESGRYLPSGIFPAKSWLISPINPRAQQAGISCTLPSSSACCLAYESQGMPCKPMSPKPWSPRPAAWWAEFHYPGRGSAISMVSLGSYHNVDSSSATPERPKTPKARTSLLHSLQTLDQDNQKEARGESGQHHCGLSTAPWLRDLPGSEVSYL